MFEWIKKLFESPKALEECQVAKNAYFLTIEQQGKEIDEKTKKLNLSYIENNLLHEQVINLEKMLPKTDENEQYWNSKYPKQTITYSGRCLPNQIDRTFEVDVRVFFTPYDQQLTDIVNRSWIGIGKLNEGTNDEKALKCLKWVRANFTYDSDKTVTGLSEFWMFPFEALKYKRGDCDDGAILLSNLMLVAGVPYWRIRLNAGDVEGGGHCYVTLCRETDNQFVCLDWCYNYTDNPVKDRPLHKDERDYYSIWFSWNLRYVFGKMETMVRTPDNNFIIQGIKNAKIKQTKRKNKV